MHFRRRLIIALTTIAGCTSFAANARAPGGGDSSRVIGSYEVTRGADSVAQVRLVEVTYAPGASSPSHSHDCPVVGYVVAGSFRSRVNAEPETVYKAGETFFERAKSTHAVSANASDRSAVKLLAVFVCPHP